MDNFVEDNNLDYIVSNSNTKIRVEEYNKVVYPDAVVICEEEQFFQNREYTILNPLVIVEVLSGSTQKFDKTTKFEMYRTIPPARRMSSNWQASAVLVSEFTHDMYYFLASLTPENCFKVLVINKITPQYFHPISLKTNQKKIKNGKKQIYKNSRRRKRSHTITGSSLQQSA